MIKFGQKVEAVRRGKAEPEKAVAIMEEDGRVFVAWPDGEVKWIARRFVTTAADRWKAAHKMDISLARWRKAAEKKGISLEEYVYGIERRKAKAERDGKAEKLREYNRVKQQESRARKKAAADGE